MSAGEDPHIIEVDKDGRGQMRVLCGMAVLTGIILTAMPPEVRARLSQQTISPVEQRAEEAGWVNNSQARTADSYQIAVPDTTPAYRIKPTLVLADAGASAYHG